MLSDLLVLKSMKKSRGGLMLGMADLSNHPKVFIGSFFAVGSKRHSPE